MGKPLTKYSEKGYLDTKTISSEDRAITISNINILTENSKTTYMNRASTIILEIIAIR